MLIDIVTVGLMFISFCMPFWPWSPGIGILQLMDCIFVQAFGRNSYPDDQLGSVLYEILHECKMDVTKALIMLKYKGFNPGSSNQALAHFVMRLHDLFHVPIIAQWEVVYAIFAIDSGWYLEHQADIDTIWPPELGYFATWHVKLECKRLMEQRGCSRPLEGGGTSSYALTSRAHNLENRSSANRSPCVGPELRPA